MVRIVADLHLHSNCSDGLNTPEEICQLIVSTGVKAFSLTDHDSVDGHAVCHTCEKSEFIPGIELTSTTKDGKELHILGYYIDSHNDRLLEVIDKIAKRRKERLRSIVGKLSNSSSLDLSWDEVEERIGPGSYNRLNLARFMVEKGLASNLDDCFRVYLGDYSDSYEAVNFFTPEKAIRLIHQAGGVAYLAHPYITRIGDMVPALVEQGLDGIEAYHPAHQTSDVKRCLEWATRFNLGVSGGSDFHGNEKSNRQILSAGLDATQLVEFMARNPQRACVTTLEEQGEV